MVPDQPLAISGPHKAMEACLELCDNSSKLCAEKAGHWLWYTACAGLTELEQSPEGSGIEQQVQCAQGASKMLHFQNYLFDVFL